MIVFKYIFYFLYLLNKVVIYILLLPLKLVRELFMSSDWIYMKYKTRFVPEWKYKFNHRKIWATIFCTIFAYSAFLLLREATALINMMDRLYDLDKMNMFKVYSTLYKKGTPIGHIIGFKFVLTTGLIGALSLFCYTWDRLGKFKNRK